MKAKEIEFEGHLIDSMILPKALDTILDLEGEFEILEFRIGKKSGFDLFPHLLRDEDEFLSFAVFENQLFAPLAVPRKADVPLLVLLELAEQPFMLDNSRLSNVQPPHNLPAVVTPLSPPHASQLFSML